MHFQTQRWHLTLHRKEPKIVFSQLICGGKKFLFICQPGGDGRRRRGKTLRVNKLDDTIAMFVKFCSPTHTHIHTHTTYEINDRANDTTGCCKCNRRTFSTKHIGERNASCFKSIYFVFEACKEMFRCICTREWRMCCAAQEAGNAGAEWASKRTLNKIARKYIRFVERIYSICTYKQKHNRPARQTRNERTNQHRKLCALSCWQNKVPNLGSTNYFTAT